ncbi:hypothetical protein [Bacillus massiliglaciei]|uniref:hypothetical protein n=1 Tax=Bacillus massiliglaciei TaxID=1816693 RepID=UPI000DA61F3B|nr:hypothetical protein [Bacillus massiliglaciei]
METSWATRFPVPSVWGIDASMAGRPLIRGTLSIQSISNNRVTGTVNFRGNAIPIQGTWYENTRQITFDSPFASFSGSLTIFDSPQSRIRQFLLRGQFLMKAPSLQAGEYGSWIATTNTTLTETPTEGYSIPQEMPPVGAFLTSTLLSQQNAGR